MKKNSLQSYKVQYRLKTELKTMNQIPISPLRMSSLVVVHCTIIKHKLELKKKSESWAIDTSAGVIFFDNSPLNK